MFEIGRLSEEMEKARRAAFEEADAQFRSSVQARENVQAHRELREQLNEQAGAMAQLGSAELAVKHATDEITAATKEHGANSLETKDAILSAARAEA